MSSVGDDRIQTESIIKDAVITSRFTERNSLEIMFLLIKLFRYLSIICDITLYVIMHIFNGTRVKRVKKELKQTSRPKIMKFSKTKGIFTRFKICSYEVSTSFSVELGTFLLLE